MEKHPSEMDRFRERMSYERKQRGWSQADLAEMLTSNGIDKMYHTTVAKIEGGDREVKLDEAAAIADLYGLSLDAMLGRKQAPAANEFVHGVRLLRGQAREHQADVRATRIKLVNQAIDVGFGGVPDNVADEWSEMTKGIDKAYTALEGADHCLQDVIQRGDQLLARLMSKQRRAKK
jgi:transcriptional regulator with XRE-family HTH domain